MGIWIYFLCMVLILIAVALGKKPMLIGAAGIVVVGFLECWDFFQAAQILYRSFVIAATEFLPVILLIGFVSALAKLLQDMQADALIARPFMGLRRPAAVFFGIGFVAWILTLLMWPTPAVSLLGAVLLSVLASKHVPPLGLAVCLCVCAEGAGLSGDFVIREAPALVARAANIPVEDLVSLNYALVGACAAVACAIGFYRYKVSAARGTARDRVTSEGVLAAETDNVAAETGSVVAEAGSVVAEADSVNGMMGCTERASEEVVNDVNDVNDVQEGTVADGVSPRRRLVLVVLMAVVFVSAAVWIMLTGVRGDKAAASVGGAAVLVLIAGTLLHGLKSSLTRFVALIKEGMMFSMGIFGPIVIIAAFFLLGTQMGAQEIFERDGDGYLAQMINGVTSAVHLQPWSALAIVMAAGVLGAMSGSGFSALPLVGGLAYALAQATSCSAAVLASAGQVAAIWTGALIVPWGFPALAGAVTQVDSGQLAKENMSVWLGVMAVTFVLSCSRFY